MRRQLLKGNALALVSLFVALSALGYNTWRNELTEHNRNIRQAGFEMLLHIGALQRITYLAHYDQDRVQGSPRTGWVEVLVLRDLSELLPQPVAVGARELFAQWRDNWEGLGREEQNLAAIDNAIHDLRNEILAALRALD